MIHRQNADFWSDYNALPDRNGQEIWSGAGDTEILYLRSKEPRSRESNLSIPV
jgi:hypothetical protein